MQKACDGHNRPAICPLNATAFIKWSLACRKLGFYHHVYWSHRNLINTKPLYYSSSQQRIHSSKSMMHVYCLVLSQRTC